MGGADLNAEDQVEDSAEGDEYSASGGNLSGRFVFHVFLYFSNLGKSPPVFSR